MDTQRLSDILLAASRTAIQLQDTETGALPAGHNGPYKDPETPVRNTSHWLITFLKCYELSDDDAFLEAARNAVDYLLSNEARPRGATYFHRRSNDKDKCNGLVGQAWTIEALAIATKYFDDSRILNRAEEVFLLHPFHKPTGLWKRVEIDGTTLPYDPTFNHQLWFAAAGGLLTQNDGVNKEVHRRVRRFLTQVGTILRTYDSGLIFHALLPQFRPLVYARLCLSDEQFNYFKTAVGTTLPIPSIRSPLHEKSIGYHSFNMYAFAMLHESFPNHEWWESVKFASIFEYMQSEEYLDSIDENPYSYPYNPPGFEVPYVEYIFEGEVSDRSKWVLNEQLSRCYDAENDTLSQGTEDPVTMAARLYQAARLPDLSIQSPKTA